MKKSVEGIGGSSKPKSQSEVSVELASLLGDVQIPKKQDYLELKIGGDFVRAYLKKISSALKKYSPGDKVRVDAPERYSISKNMMEFVAQLLRKEGWEVKVEFDSGDLHDSGYAYLSIS